MQRFGVPCWILSAVLEAAGIEGEIRPSLLPSRDPRRKPCISLVIQGWTQLLLFFISSLIFERVLEIRRTVIISSFTGRETGVQEAPGCS